MSARPNLIGVYVFARNLAETLAFYRLIGISIEEVSDVFARATMASGVMIEFGTSELTQSYDPDWQQPVGLGSNTLNIELGSRDAVDRTYEALVVAGYAGHLSPIDAPWQARFAIVDDPNGNPVGLHSPRNVDDDRARERTS